MASHVSTVNMDEWVRYKVNNPYSIAFLNHMPILESMIGENRQLVTNEPVEFEK